jgi:uncharacterized protein YndB with AHSA1/START domain
MATHVITVDAPVERAFVTLEDPRSLAHFVVGNRNVRRFDPRWPVVGTKVDHSIGVGPLVIRDQSVVVAAEPPRRLVLDAKIRPFGTFRVAFHLSPEGPDGRRTKLRIDESPVAGAVARKPLAAVSEGVLRIRNREMARRLRRLVEEREERWREWQRTGSDA